MYQITSKLLTGIPTTPYRNGVGAYEGVVCHATESTNHSGGDTPSGERDFEQSTHQNAFVHFFVGVEQGNAVIVQTAPTDYTAWGAGAAANQRYVHVELCMYDDPATFSLAYGAYIWLLAKLLKDRNLDVTPAHPDGTGTVWAHSDVTNYLGGTTHTDPNSYLAAHGITWDQHIANIKSVGGDKMQLEDWQWKMLGNALDGLYKKGLLSDYTWAEKAYGESLTSTELAWINAILYARQNGVQV